MNELYAEPKGCGRIRRFSLSGHHGRFIPASYFLILGADGDVSLSRDHPEFVFAIDHDTVLLSD
ncbi:MAG: hypothetical protein ACKVIK_06015 [Rhodospirillales bacterium]